MAYKRNQLETAIERSLYGVRARPADASALRVRIKRLTETDRGLGLEQRGTDDGKRFYAFFDEPPPGRGTEITYSAFGVFALLLAIRFMDAGWPQTEAVSFLRRIKSKLDQEHTRILTVPWDKLIDHRPAKTVEQEVANGRLVEQLGQMAFLIALPGQLTVQIDKKGGIAIANIVRGKTRLAKVLEHLGVSGGGAPILCLELVNPAHQLAYWLSKTEPAKRGRK
jgi:hypothetical protein